jgi:hypothetical protein
LELSSIPDTLGTKTVTDDYLHDQISHFHPGDASL